MCVFVEWPQERSIQSMHVCEGLVGGIPLGLDPVKTDISIDSLMHYFLGCTVVSV